ncbi:uncharacterized protein LOC135683945 isoform X2 [Rhopilema esculentum]|uniref:uncharacterized protein LOC135683945 isoform X2 n=1 Tax=Rhopilema esculentum TaxID=499914 RepID=UPI0031DC7516
MFSFLAIFALGTSAVIAGNSKTYPGFTVFDKDGEYVKFIGPLYGRFKMDWNPLPPYSLKSKVSLHAVITPTVDILSLFMNGTIFFEKMPIKYLDEYEDNCLFRWIKCPYRETKPYNGSMKIKFMETGLIPGWYEGAVDASTVIKGKRLRLAGFKFKLKLRDDS